MTPRRFAVLATLLAAAAAGAAIAGRLRRRGAPDAEAPPPATRATPPPASAAPPPAEAPTVEAAPAETSAVEGYCMKERKKVEIADPKPVKTKNGRDAIRGRCPDCGSAIFRMGKLPGA